MITYQILKVFELQKNGSFKNITEQFPFAKASFSDELNQYMHYPQKGEYIRDYDKNIWKISNIVTDAETNWERVIVSYIVKPTKLKMLY